MQRSRESGLTTVQIILIVVGVGLALVGLIAAIVIPSLMKSQQAAREISAIQDVRTIGYAQATYQTTNGAGSFGDLQTLGREGLISSSLASGDKGGYIFSCTPINVAGSPPMFDLTARPSSTGKFGTGNLSYYTNETNVIYEAEGGEPPSATPQDRSPKNGNPIR
jgi:type II secretory pathway pseudopilin PulG